MSAMDKQIAMMFKMAGKELGHMSNTGDTVQKAIIENAAGAAAASLAAGWLPGIGALAATAVSAGFIWGMYYRINNALGISISKNVLKSLASALLTNIVTQLGGIIAIEVTAAALSLIPGIGSASAMMIIAAVNYGVVYVAGLVYIKMLTELFKANKDISSMTADDIRTEANNTFVQNKTEYQNSFDEAREEAKRDIKNGKIKKEDSFDPENQ